MDRVLQKALLPENLNKGPNSEPFDYERDFYGETNYWFRVSLPLKIVTFIYLVLYFPLRVAVGLLSLLSPLNQLNTILQIQKK